VIDWGGKVAGWFFGVGGLALGMALYLDSAVQPWRGWRHDLADALLCVAAACMIGCLLTGPAAIAALVRRRQLKKRELALHAAAGKPDVAGPGRTEPDLAGPGRAGHEVPPIALAPRADSRHHGFKRRHLAVAAVVALGLGSLSALGIVLSQGENQHAGKLATPALATPPHTSHIEICHQNGNELYALAMPSHVIINAGVANVSAGATKWGLTANVTYNQDLEMMLSYGNRTSPPQNLGFTARLVQPITHKGDIWTITWQVTAGTSTADISASVNLGRPDATLAYAPGSAQLLSPNTAGKDVLSRVDDSELLAPSHPLQTLYPDSFTGGSSVTVHFLVQVPGFIVATNAKSPTNGKWLSELYVPPGSTLPVEITVQNGGNTTLYGVTINITLPRGLTYVTGSTAIASSLTTREKPEHDGIVVPNDSYPGVSLGTLLPGQENIVRLNVRVEKDIGDGASLSSVAMGHAANMAYYVGTLTVHVQ
jgi:uncharacterized repeat protein (TIGR01451 family)